MLKYRAWCGKAVHANEATSSLFLANDPKIKT